MVRRVVDQLWVETVSICALRAHLNLRGLEREHMKYNRQPPIEVRGYRNALVPIFDKAKFRVVDKWMSVPAMSSNDFHCDDDFQTWNPDEGSREPPF